MQPVAGSIFGPALLAKKHASLKAGSTIT